MVKMKSVPEITTFGLKNMGNSGLEFILKPLHAGSFFKEFVILVKNLPFFKVRENNFPQSRSEQFWKKNIISLNLWLNTCIFFSF